MNLSEGIEITLVFGEYRKCGSYTFTRFESKRLINLSKKMCKEFIEETSLSSINTQIREEEKK